MQLHRTRRLGLMYLTAVVAGLFDPEEGQGFARLDTEVTAEQDSKEAARDAVILLKNDANTSNNNL